ncbi:GYDIA family GHMP kinase [Hanstruepera marina]|uniref:GYDIA family GHMP kinase n=1 Tax=Hanstruepera marina TaxID=2873265 RepID=UPI001CA6E923
MPNSNFYSNGKLLLTGEYLVLDGALALALPTKHGQSLVISPNTSDFIDWKSYDENHEVWFKDTFFKEEVDNPKKQKHNNTSKKLLEILHVAKLLNPDFNLNHLAVETHLTFPRNWGLGTSSTLINNIAQWAQVDPYELLKLTFGGSGYDIACAQHNSAITYRLTETERLINTVDFNPEFIDNLFFVYLNQKQNSRDAIKAYRNNQKNLTQDIQTISSITQNIVDCHNLSEFETVINKHEAIMSSVLKTQPVKDRLFPDFSGTVKSLGAWGGDFVLVTAKENPSDYFKAKGFKTVIPYSKIIL